MAAYNYSTNPYYAPLGGANFSPYGGNQTLPPLQQQPQQQSGSIMTVFVNSEDDVMSYPVAAGTTVLLLSFNLNKFWLKSTSTNGVPEGLREFPFKETTPKSKSQPDSVSRDEFNALSKKIDKLLKDLGGSSNE